MSWIEHVKQYQKEHGCSYKEALIGAKGTYKKTKGAGLRAIARKMHGKGCEITGSGNYQTVLQNNLIEWSFASLVILIAIAVIIDCLGPAQPRNRQIAPELLQQVRRNVQQQLIQRGEQPQLDNIINLTIREMRQQRLISRRNIEPLEMLRITNDIERQMQIEQQIMERRRIRRNNRRNRRVQQQPQPLPQIPEEGEEEETRVSENV